MAKRSAGARRTATNFTRPTQRRRDAAYAFLAAMWRLHPQSFQELVEDTPRIDPLSSTVEQYHAFDAAIRAWTTRYRINATWLFGAAWHAVRDIHASHDPTRSIGGQAVWQMAVHVEERLAVDAQFATKDILPLDRDGLKAHPLLVSREEWLESAARVYDEAVETLKASGRLSTEQVRTKRQLDRHAEMAVMSLVLGHSAGIIAEKLEEPDLDESTVQKAIASICSELDFTPPRQGRPRSTP